jgi:NADH-quinone oxidoreductase subunit A
MYPFKTSSLLLLEFTKLGVFVIIAIVIVLLIIFLSTYLTTSNPDAQKLSTYECGFEPYEDAKNLFDVRFYLVAILFIVFDLEAVYFFPWAIYLNELSSNGFWMMLEFLVELLIGFIYAWKKGALDWE